MVVIGVGDLGKDRIELDISLAVDERARAEVLEPTLRALDAIDQPMLPTGILDGSALVAAHHCEVSLYHRCAGEIRRERVDVRAGGGEGGDAGGAGDRGQPRVARRRGAP